MTRAQRHARGGSSPLTRGKPADGGRPHHQRGLIPAHAGKTRHRHARVQHVRAHPRSRGENAPRSSLRFAGRGSSPLTRGKPAVQAWAGCVEGLIPAHAGKTICTTCATCPIWAHPRSRGENHRMKSVAASLMGSSPLTRGKLSGELVDARPTGLIPAHAGKTV